MSRAVSRVFAVIFCLIILWIRAGQTTSEIQKSAPGCHLTMRKVLFEYEYYQEGDVIVGGIFTVNTGIIAYDNTYISFYKRGLCVRIDITQYWNILALIFAVDEINKNPDILPNITLGYHVFDPCGDSQKAVQNVLQILSGNKREAPNYSCHERGKVVGFIGDQRPVTSLPMAQILSLYGYTQISSGSSNPQLSDRALYPYLFRIAPDPPNIYLAVLQLLKHFGWNWVGVITSNDEAGERELRELSHVITNSGVCIAFVVMFHHTRRGQQESLSIIKKSNTQVVITTGTCSIICIKFFQNSVSVLQNITLILETPWTIVFYSYSAVIRTFNGSLSFKSAPYTYPVNNYYFNNVSLSSRPKDPLLEDIWLVILRCFSQNYNYNYKKLFIFNRFYKYTPRNCTGNERLVDVFNETGDVSATYYFGLYIIAIAVHNMHLSMNYLDSNPEKYKYHYKIHNYVQRMCIKEITGKDRCFNERGEIPGRYYLTNWKISLLEEYKFKVDGYPVGELDTSSLMDQPLRVFEKPIIWKTGKVPRARCNDYCPPGYRKAPNGGYHVCCYDCLECSEGEVSNITDTENCWKCPKTEWPDESRVKCIPKMYDFLSYQMDIFAHIFTSISVIFIFITILILGIFVLFRHTPVVKANNLNMSFLLLGSIMLSFICVFLFLGRPVDITCMLRQTIFSIIYSVSVSSLLAKTVMVYIAFKATKPESSWRQLVLLKVSNSIVLICSCVQVFINVVWLSTFPPFQEFDMHSYLGKIIVQCNEGSVIAFYSALGYLGILAAVSFVLAFMVRTLPDSFNEAKYITFSMLLFCSVWIAMIPAYLSTKGKNMVSVEIFAILASSAGLLGCIFFPKCYILLLKPETNTRKHVFEKNKQ